MKPSRSRIWSARVLVAAVFIINVQCALQFLIWPSDYTLAYQLEGPAAEAIVRSFGICFLMWNATFPPVIVKPERFRVLFMVVIAQQIIGFIGESLLLVSLGPGLEQLAASVTRFAAFDGTGLVLLVIAFALSRAPSQIPSQGSSQTPSHDSSQTPSHGSSDSKRAKEDTLSE